MKSMSKSIFSFAFLLLGLAGYPQQTTKKDSVAPKTERYGIRVGVDVVKLGRTFFEKDYRGIELVGDYKLTRKHYIAAEIGNEQKTTDDEQLNFTTSGTYLKAGFDYNAYKNWVGMENMIYVGLRYGISSFNQTLNNYEVYNPNNYFGEAQLIESGEEFGGLSAQWAEVVAGIKAEVLKNVYVGFSVRMNYLVTDKKPENFDNLHIPGYGRTYNGKFGAGLNYTVSYFLPLYKSKVKQKAVSKKR